MVSLGPPGIQENTTTPTLDHPPALLFFASEGAFRAHNLGALERVLNGSKTWMS